MKYSFAVFLLVALMNLAAAHRPEPIVYNLTSTWGNSGTIDIVGGQTVQLTTAGTPGAQVQFVDLLPEANWKHPAQFRVIAPNGNVLEQLAVERPPVGLIDAQIVSGARPAWFKPAQIKIDDRKGSMRIKDPQNHYAFLFNGHADQRHWNDFSFLYQVLTQLYGYDPKNIIVADGTFKDRLADLDGNGTADIQYGSTKAELLKALDYLKNTLTTKDDLIFAVNDHGGTMDGESTIVLQDTEIKASEFAPIFNQIKARKVISIYEQCYSGGFVKPTVGANRVAMAAATANEFSWASMDLLFDEFIYHAISAFAMQNHKGEPVASDVNGDGKISAKEAFAWAVAHDLRDESPVMEAASNSGDSAERGIGF